MADISSVVTYVDGFRDALDGRMESFFRNLRSMIDSFESVVDNYRDTELDYITQAISDIISEQSGKLTTNKVSTNPLDSFKEIAALSTISEYTPEYKDITTDTAEIVDNLLELLNLPNDSSSILSLVSKSNYTPSVLKCADSFISKCLTFTSDIGLPSDLYSSIVDFELEKNLLELKYLLSKSDAKFSSKGFRKPISSSVYQRTELIEKFNRDRLPKYKEAIETVNNRMADLLSKAIQAQLSKINVEIDMSGSLVDDLISASVQQMELEVELRKIELLSYRVDSQEAITSLQQGLKAIKAKEEAGRKVAQTLFKVQLDKALAMFEAYKAKAQSDIYLSVKESAVNSEVLVSNIKAKVQEISFIRSRLADWSQAMAKQSDDKITHLQAANKSYQEALKTTGQNAIALSTEK